MYAHLEARACIHQGAQPSSKQADAGYCILGRARCWLVQAVERLEVRISLLCWHLATPDETVQDLGFRV